MLSGCSSENSENSQFMHLFCQQKSPTEIWQKRMTKYNNVYVFNDSLLILENTEKEASLHNFFINVRTLNNNKEVGNFFKYGADEDYLLGASSIIHNDTLIVYDYIKRYIYMMNLNRNSFDNNIYISKKKTNILTQYFLLHKNSIIIQNPYCFMNGPRCFRNDGKRFIVSDYNYNYNERIKYRYDTFNVVRGQFVLNWSKKRIFYADAYTAAYELYTADMKLLSKFSLPLDIPSAEYIRYKYNSKTTGIIFKGEIPEAFTALCATDDYIYTLFSGESIKDDQDRTNFHSYLIIFDWDGNPISVYNINAHGISISVPENNDCIYIYGQTSKHEYNLFKFVLK